MTNIDGSLLKDQQWSGIFHPPEHPEKVFAGTLKFSPTDGLTLQFLMPWGLLDNTETYDCLHGSLLGGIPCTLVGSFKPVYFGMSMRNGYTYQTHSDYRFQYAIFGVHCEAGETFEGFHFKVTGLDEFFRPKRSLELTPYQEKSILSTKVEGGNLVAFHSANFSFLPDDLRSIIYTRDDKDAIDELQKAYELIKAKYKNFHPYFKKSLSHGLEIKFSPELNVVSAYNRLSRFADLFSLFFMGPAKIERISAVAKDEDGRKAILPIFPSTLHGKEALERATTEISFDDLPINASELDLAKAFNLWEPIASTSEMITSSLQNKRHSVARHETLSAILLSVTQLEDMAFQAGEKEQRFAYGPNKYATSVLRKLLCHLFSCQESELGIAISDLRNEIAHSLKPKKFLDSISSRNLFSINYLLESIVVCALLEKIGVPSQTREKFQERIVRGVVFHSRG